jgi:hypothetical protein
MGSSHDGGGDVAKKRPDISAQQLAQPMPQALPQPPVAYPSFLPNDPRAMASGLTPGMVAAINANANPAPLTAPPGGQGGGTVPTSPAASGGAVPQLQMPSDQALSRLGPRYKMMAQQIVDSTNKTGTLEAYLDGRDRLAALMHMAGGPRPERGSGPGYGSSGPGGVGFSAGRTV